MCFTGGTDEEKRGLMRELDTMKSLERHPNVVQLIGCVTTSGLT